MRFALWQVLQAGARTEQRAIAAKGLTGPGYDGHAFWDTEMYVLPVLTYTQPGGRRRCPAPGAKTPCRPPPNGPASWASKGAAFPVADDPRRGVLRVLAGQHGRLARQRRTWPRR